MKIMKGIKIFNVLCKNPENHKKSQNFKTRITKIMQRICISCENHENHKNLWIWGENHENLENLRIPLRSFENH